MFHPHFGEGSLNKYAWIGNLCGQTVDRGRFWTRWPTPDELNQWIERHAREHPIWTCLHEARYDYDPEGIERERRLLGLAPGLLKSRYDNYSLNLGDRTRPIWLLVGGTHGPESIGSLGLLSLVESISETIDADEPLRRFLEHYCLKIYPLNNPLDYTTQIYRDPWAGPGWTMRNVNPESSEYRFFMGHDIHGNPGTLASAQQGNGHWVEEAVRQCNARFKDRYLDGPPDHQYGSFTGFGNAVGEMRPRLRRCIYPAMQSRTLSMGSEMPDLRMGLFSDSMQLPTPDGKFYSLTRGKLWPLQSYFTLPVTDVVASYLYQEMMPHPWADVRLDCPDPSCEVRLWRYQPQQAEGLMVATFRKAGAPRITDWEYLDVVRVRGSSPSVVKNDLDGRWHVAGLVYSFPLKAGSLRSNRVWREEDMAGPTFLRWHWLGHPDVFRPLIRSHWVLWDVAGDGRLACMVDRDNDGVYEVRSRVGDRFARSTVGYYAGAAGHDGWADLSSEGFSALGTWIQVQGGTVRTVRPGESWNDLSLLILGRLTPSDVTPSLVDRLVAYVAGGGRVLIDLPDLLSPFPANDAEGPPRYWMKLDGEVDWQVAMRQENWDPTPLYQRRLLPYARLCAALGALPLPRTVANYQRIHGGWCWLDPYFNRKPGLADRSGLKLAGPHDRLMLEAFALEPLTPDMRPLLQLHGQPVLMGGRRGQGWIMVSGTPDLFRNRAISEKLHEPDDWNQPGLPEPAENIRVRHELLAALLEGRLQPEPGTAIPMLSHRDVRVDSTRAGIHVQWLGADGQTRHFTIRDYPNGGTPGLHAAVQLGLGQQEAVVELKAVPHILNRSRASFETRYGETVQVILRDRHEFLPRTGDAAEEYVFTFVPGRDYCLLRYRIEPIGRRYPFARQDFALEPSPELSKGASSEDLRPRFWDRHSMPPADADPWQTVGDPQKKVQILRSDQTFFALVARAGRLAGLRCTTSAPVDCEIVIFSGSGDPGRQVAEMQGKSFEQLQQCTRIAHPLERVWTQALEPIRRAWQQHLASPGWIPSDADLTNRWRLDLVGEHLRQCRPEKAETLLHAAPARTN